MYLPKFKTFQSLIPLLKEHNVRHIVISPGSRMREFVLSVEEDPYFVTYNVTDERSASYFAIGISQELDVPVAITCTSSTATTNYLPGITEAYYQGVKIVVLTGDRDPYMLGQQEDQMINQVGMYDSVVRKSVTLPIVNNNFDKWYCERLINEALLEFDHHKTGPVHINVPVPAMITWNDDKQITDYPKVKAIHRLIYNKDIEKWKEKVLKLSKANRILIIAGQNTTNFNPSSLIKFFNKYNCVIHAEHMGNIEIDGKINISALSDGIPQKQIDEFIPDIIISFHGTLGITRNLKESIRKKECEHWLIDEAGNLIDAYRNLTTIFECNPFDFFDFFNNNASSELVNNRIYYNQWLKLSEQFKHPEIKFSNVFAIKSLLKKLPENIILHLSILNSIRISQFYTLPQNTKVYANIGTDGIDGSMSTFFGQATATNKECYLIIGDLSFFYDMNSLRIKHNKNNIHILLINNHGGNEFYQQEIMPTTDQGLGAKHTNSAKAWSESCGFKYLSAYNEEEYISNLNEFIKKDQPAPVLLEVFTEQMADREAVFSVKKAYYNIFDKNAELKETVKSVIGESNVKTLKKIFRKK